MTPFAPSIAEAAVADFRERLQRARLPDPELVDDSSQGLPITEALRLRDALLEHDFGTCLAEMEALGERVFRNELVFSSRRRHTR